MSEPRIAVVGMGGFARTHHQYVKRVEEAGLGCHVAQVAIPTDQETFAAELETLREQGVEIFASLREMLAVARKRIDLVCIPTGIPLHRPMAVAALEAGCHVLVEKPAAGSIQDLDAMVAAAERADRLCAVGFQHMYQPEYRQVKEWVCQGRLGKIRQIRSFGCWPRDPQYYGRNGWAGRLAVGDTWVLDGPHNNALGHAVNVMCFLGSGDPDGALHPLSMQAELYRVNQIESADTVAFRTRTAEGTEVFFAMSHCTEENVNPLFVLIGDKGRLELTYEGDIRAVWEDGNREELAAVAKERAGVLEDVVRVVAGDQDKLACPLALTRSQVLCTCGTFESSAIHEIPESLRTVDAESGAVVVPGMDEYVQRAFAEGALFSELGIDWARPGEIVDLEGYDYFPTYRRQVGS